MSRSVRQFFRGQQAFDGVVWVQCIRCRLTVSKHPAGDGVVWFDCRACEKAVRSHAELHSALAKREVLPAH